MGGRLCQVCASAVAEYTCETCGATVCERHYDRSTGLCGACSRGLDGGG